MGKVIKAEREGKRKRQKDRQREIFLSTNLNTKENPPWATGKDSY